MKVNKENRNYQINQMKKQLVKRPTTKVDRFKMKKVKKIWVFACAVTTIFGVNAVMDMTPMTSQVDVNAQTLKEPEIDFDYFKYKDPLVQDGGTTGTNIVIKLPDNFNKKIKSITYSNGNERVTVQKDEFTNSNEKYTMSIYEPLGTLNPTKKIVKKYLQDPVVVEYEGGDSLTTSLANGEAIESLGFYVNDYIRKINENLDNFDNSYKIKTHESYIKKSNEIADFYQNNLIPVKEIVLPSFDEYKLIDKNNFDKNILDFLKLDRENQNNQFGMLTKIAEEKKANLSKITDAVSQDDLKKAIAKVDDYLKQAKEEVFDTHNDYSGAQNIANIKIKNDKISPKSTEWVNKINAIDVERIKIEKPKLSPIK